MDLKREQFEKKVLDNVEIGSAQTRITIANDGVSREYIIRLTYGFSYADKEGVLNRFSIERSGNDERFECDGIGEHIAAVLIPLIAADFPNGVDVQQRDMVSEIIEAVQGECDQNNWLFFNFLRDREEHYGTT